MSRTVEKALNRIERKLDLIAAGREIPPAPVIGIREVMLLTGTHSVRAAYRVLKQLGVRRHLHGKYLRLDVTNAVHSRHQSDVLSEARTEARISHSVSVTQ